MQKIQNNLLANFRTISRVDSTFDQYSDVSTSVAHFTRLCAQRFARIFDIIEKVRTTYRTFALSEHERALILLQFDSGLRVSELLRITFRDINEFGYIFVKGLKGSSDRIVISSDNLLYWLNLRARKIEFPVSINRFYYYRLLKRIGIIELLSTHQHSSVTHLLRYFVVYRMLSGGGSIEAVQHYLGHKSVNSTIHYLNQLKYE